MKLLDKLKRLFNRKAGLSKIDKVFGGFQKMISDLEEGKRLSVDQRDENGVKIQQLATENSALSQNIIRADKLKGELEKLLDGSR